MTDAPDEVGGPTVSLAEAAATSSLSLATIRRRLQNGKIPGAARNDDRSWSIPVAGLSCLITQALDVLSPAALITEATSQMRTPPAVKRRSGPFFLQGFKLYPSTTQPLAPLT